MYNSSHFFIHLYAFLTIQMRSSFLPVAFNKNPLLPYRNTHTCCQTNSTRPKTASNGQCLIVFRPLEYLQSF